jgi:predicted GNAT family acetyltransferase
MMHSLISLQEYLLFKASQHHEVVSSPPFTTFFHTTDSSEDTNYAIPNISGNSHLPDDLAKLQAMFKEHDRKPRLEFIEEVFPHLSPILHSAGWSKVEQSQMMICLPETYRPAPEVLGLAITTLSHESGIEEIREGLDTNILGFDPLAERATLQEAEEFRQSLILSWAFTARLYNQPVAAGIFTEIHEGLTELVGITTLEPFRRRGIAVALTAYMTQIAFQQGATRVFLIAANKQAGRAYERVGFQPQATQVVYEVSASGEYCDITV